MQQSSVSKNLSMYGVEDMAGFVENVKRSITYQFTGALMVVAGLMSDAQELMAYGDVESARQALNRAKHLTFMIQDGELVASVEGV